MTMKKALVQTVCAGVAVLAVSLAWGGTVAYWPMVMDPATGGTSREIADVAGNHYDLKVNLSDAQVVNTSEGVFSRPPNGPADVTASSCVEINNGTSLTVFPFYRGSSSQSRRGLTVAGRMRSIRAVSARRAAERWNSTIRTKAVAGSIQVPRA